jgi:uncharacterized protein involved in exopolysaccharide biosynthesis
MNNNEISFNGLIDVVIKKRAAYFRLILASVFLSLSIYFIMPKKYTAEMSITQTVPSGSAGLGNVSSLASSFGINLGSMKGDTFYLPNIIKSKSLQKNIVLKKRIINDENTTFVEYFNRKTIFNFFEKSEQENLINAMDIFSDSMIVLEDQNSGMITVKFISSYPELSYDVINDIQFNVNNFLNSGLNLQASSMLKLINGEIVITKSDLTISENLLAAFVENNRSYLDSPNLLLEYARLSRDIQILNEKYLNLIIQQTMAMIEEKKQLPQLNMISEPILNPNIYSPSLVYISVITLLLSIALMTSYILYNHQRPK